MKEPQSGLEGLARDPRAAGLLKNRALLDQLAGSPDAQRLMGLLDREAEGGLKQAAASAARGDLSALTRLVKQVAESAEGARLVHQINEKIDQGK